VKALREMARVLKPGGRLVVATWDSLERTPGYRAMVGLLRRLFGAEIAGALRAPFVLGEPDELRDLFKMAGVAAPKIETITGEARFPSLNAWVRIDVRGWTLADVLDDAQYAQLQKAAQCDLWQFQQPDGSVVFDSPAHIVTATKA
jgi:SAM-dependent methyltransferase